MRKISLEVFFRTDVIDGHSLLSCRDSNPNSIAIPLAAQHDRNVQRTEFDSIAAVSAMTDFPISNHFQIAVDTGPRSIAVDARPSSRGHFSAFPAAAALRSPIDRRSISAFQRSSCLRLRKFRPLSWMRGGKFRSGSRCQRHPVMDEMPSSFQTCGSGTKVSITSATSSDESVLALVTPAALANARAKNKHRDSTK